MKYKIREEHQPYRFFWMTPNIIDDTEMSLVAFRLYAHLKRVAGEDGACWQSTETIAKKCFMSAGSVSNAKKELEKLGLIRILTEKNKHGGKDYHEIVIIDIWGRNIDKFSTSSPGELASSPNEFASSPGELKNTPLGKPIEEVRLLTASQSEKAVALLSNVQYIIGTAEDKYLAMVLFMEEKYGEADTIAALMSEYKKWTNTKGESGTLYNPLNYGWVEWAFRKLVTPEDNQYDVIRHTGGGCDL